jgi:hypothetical protein
MEYYFTVKNKEQLKKTFGAMQQKPDGAVM